MSELTKNPLVSIIIPTYNSSKYIEDALNSVITQDYVNKEIIIVDDGSSDDTIAKLTPYLDEIKIIKQKNMGSGAARNNGLENSNGKYIAFLDSDDLWLPGKLSAQIEYLEEHPDVKLVYGSWDSFKNDPVQEIKSLSNTAITSTEIDRESSGWIYDKLIEDCIVWTSTVVMHRELLTTVGYFDVNLRRGQDYDYWLRVSRVTQIHKLLNLVSLYRIHNESITRRPLDINYGFLIFDKLKKNWGYTGPNGQKISYSALNKRIADIWYGYAYQHYHHGNHDIALISYAKSLSYWPFRLSTWKAALMPLYMLIKRFFTTDR